MFKKILLPLDLTTKHQRALDVAEELASQSGGNVTLLHVIEEIHGLARSEELDFFKRLEQSAQRALDKLGRRLTERGIDWQGVICYGNRVREVVRYAKKQRCDLIVATAPRFESEHPATSWGSLSWKIGILAPCPVLLVK